MWQSVLNHFQSLWTYQDLSPDTGVRRKVNARLRDRDNLPLAAWSDVFLQSSTMPLSAALLAFVYIKMPAYSGLDIGRIRPDDRLIEDLKLPLVCWFDWSIELCGDFYETFQVDISEEFDESLLATMADLVCFLNQRLQSRDSVSLG